MVFFSFWLVGVFLAVAELFYQAFSGALTQKESPEPGAVQIKTPLSLPALLEMFPWRKYSDLL